MFPICSWFSFRVPLAVVVLGRDVLLSLSAFYIRYTTLPHPVSSPFLFYRTIISFFFSEKTLSRYWDFSIPSAEVRPTDISKVLSFSSCHILQTSNRQVDKHGPSVTPHGFDNH